LSKNYQLALLLLTDVEISARKKGTNLNDGFYETKEKVYNSYLANLEGVIKNELNKQHRVDSKILRQLYSNYKKAIELIGSNANPDIYKSVKDYL